MPLRAIVCLAQVPEDGARLRLAAGGGRLETEGISWALSTFDRYALDAALRLRDARGGEVVAVHVGPDRPPSVLTEALALGADAGLHVWDPGLSDLELDPSVVARLLHGAIEPLRPFDLILAGHHAVGPDNGLTPVLLAEHLGVALVTGAVSIEWGGDELHVTRETQGVAEEWACSVPALVSTHKGAQEPRPRSLKGLLAAKKKPIERRTLADLGMTSSDVVRDIGVAGLALAPPRPAVRWLGGDVDEQARAVAEWLGEVTL